MPQTVAVEEITARVAPEPRAWVLERSRRCRKMRMTVRKMEGSFVI